MSFTQLVSKLFGREEPNKASPEEFTPEMFEEYRTLMNYADQLQHRSEDTARRVRLNQRQLDEAQKKLRKLEKSLKREPRLKHVPEQIEDQRTYVAECVRGLAAMKRVEVHWEQHKKYFPAKRLRLLKTLLDKEMSDE